jgi:hypothetical protein
MELADLGQIRFFGILENQRHVIVPSFVGGLEFSYNSLQRNPRLMENLRTLKTFDNAVTAEIALNFLNSHGISAQLADEQLVETSWYLSNAIQGIKLQVPESEFNSASELLESRDQQNRSHEEEDESPSLRIPSRPHLRLVGVDNRPDAVDESQNDYDSSPYDDDEVDYRQPVTRAEKDTQRAVRGLVFGLIILPLQFYVSGLVIMAWLHRSELRPRYQKQLWLVTVFHLLFMSGLGYYFWLFGDLPVFFKKIFLF